jgi:hypothetical protein
LAEANNVCQANTSSSSSLSKLKEVSQSRLGASNVAPIGRGHLGNKASQASQAATGT